MKAASTIVLTASQTVRAPSFTNRVVGCGGDGR
jgi:hypothetical protein